MIDLDADADDVEGDGAAGGSVREAHMCCMRTNAWREMLNVEVCVIRNNVSMCLLSLRKLSVVSRERSRWGRTQRQQHPSSQTEAHGSRR